MDIESVNITKTCSNCKCCIWIRYDYKEKILLNEDECPHCKTSHIDNDEFVIVETIKSPMIDTNSGVKGRDWHKGLSSDWKDFKNKFKKRHNNGNNNLPTY